MVRNHNFHKSAFTMLELIFAIVIISIAMLSLPMMVQINTKGMESNMNQKAIFAASVKISDLSAFVWDANTLDNDGNERVVNIGNDCIEKNQEFRRVGHITRKCLDDNSIRPADSASSTYNLNNTIHDKEEIYLNIDSSNTGYKKQYYSSLQITRKYDIKYITLTISDDDKTLVVLKTQKANIGEPKIHSKSFY